MKIHNIFYMLTVVCNAKFLNIPSNDGTSMTVRIGGFKRMKPIRLDGAYLNSEEEFPPESLVAESEFDIVDNSNCFNYVRDQGACGSCWAHGATLAIQGSFCKKYGLNASFDLSVEHLLSCSTHSEIETGDDMGELFDDYGGCDGNDELVPFEFALNNPVAQEVDYPYNSYWLEHGKHSCKKIDKEGFSIDKVVTGKARSAQAMVDAVNEFGVVAVSICAQIPSFLMFHRNMHRVPYLTKENCAPSLPDYYDEDDDEEMMDLDHIVVIVGYHFEKNSKEPIFKIRNSWGSKFGEEGHVYMKLGACLLGRSGPIGTIPGPIPNIVVSHGDHDAHEIKF